jgi:cbb3-type cytochrome oxidase maturation protein
MEIFVLIMILSFIFFAGLLVTLIWGIRDGQFDDLQTPAERILWDDPKGDSDAP